jgi:hypothetical protein
LNKVIEIVVNPRGEATVQTRGFIGGECREASKFVLEALGQKTAETFTAEYYQVQQAGQHLEQST